MEPNSSYIPNLRVPFPPAEGGKRQRNAKEALGLVCSSLCRVKARGWFGGKKKLRGPSPPVRTLAQSSLITLGRGERCKPLLNLGLDRVGSSLESGLEGVWALFRHY